VNVLQNGTKVGVITTRGFHATYREIGPTINDGQNLHILYNSPKFSAGQPLVPGIILWPQWPLPLALIIWGLWPS